MAGGVCREIDVVVLDKDGTLTDFHSAWGGRYVRSVTAVVEAARGDNALKAALYHTLAINAADGRFQGLSHCVGQDRRQGHHDSHSATSVRG